MNKVTFKLLNSKLIKNIIESPIVNDHMSDLFYLKFLTDEVVTSLDKIRANSDNPKWFDGTRAMKVITNLISHKIDAKYIIPTKINMEDGIKMQRN